MPAIIFFQRRNNNVLICRKPLLKDIYNIAINISAASEPITAPMLLSFGMNMRLRMKLIVVPMRRNLTLDVCLPDGM